ncbi:hypothetical protein M8J75_005103 [Diaphorina citri]|nr:hypothetical protein M8J75_005103 [Diaphorina citri]
MRLFESRTVLIVIGVLAQLSCLVSSLPKACPKFDVLYGRTRSRSRGRAMRITCNRGYNLIGERTLLCNKGKWDSEIPVCAKPGCPLPESRIPNGKVSSRYNHQIIRTVCEDGFEMQGSPIIFCNGIVWNDTLPVCLGKPGVKACDFEGKDQFCGWHQTRNMLTWQMGYDPLEAWVAWGPDFDHTYGVGGFGHYIHMKGPTEATRYLTFGQLKSPTYRKPDNPDVCFQFWFHVYGEEAGDLKILVNREEVWKRQQINRKLWQRGSLHFVANSTYQITIEASVPSALVTVALDDLEVIENCTKTDYAVLGTASSCEGRCGDDGTLDDCSCDYDCHEVDNCCPDLSFYCPNIALGTDTTVIMETSAVTSKGDIPVTTFLPLVENETVASPSEETTLHPNIVDQNINQDQSQGVEENQNINIIASQTPIDNNQENNNIEKVYENTEQVQEKINNSSGEKTEESSNKGSVEENQNINVIASQTPVDNNQENNNIEVNQKDINENIEHIQEKISNSTSQRTEDNFNNGIQENNLGNAGNENQEIDVPFDNINTTTSEQTSDNMQGTSSPSNVDTSLDTNQEKSPSERFIENSIASNKTFYKLGVDRSNQNDKTSFEYNGNVYQNFPQNKNRMRGSVKKSTVVYEEEENQLNPTQILSNETKTKEYAFEAITRGYQVINNTKIDDPIIIQNTTIKDEDQTLTEQHSNLENVTIDTKSQPCIHINESIIFSNDTDLIKENVDAINNKQMESKLANTTKDEQNIVENNIGPSENETLVSKTNEMNTENMTKSNNNENPSAFNRNFTKIILYKNFNYDNSSGTNASHIQHMNDISRVQIHTTVQSNGTQVVENVNMNDIGKYNETTIARLKQIHDHINNVITAKKNVTQAANASQVENNNATVLHKLKNFITNIIESHNNSKLLTNNTENTETASNVSPTEQDTEELSSQMNRTLNVTHHNTAESIYSDGLLMLSDKVADYNTSKPVNSTEIPINQDNPGLKKPSEDIDQTADKDEKYIKQTATQFNIFFILENEKTNKYTITKHSIINYNTESGIQYLAFSQPVRNYSEYC